MAKIRAYVCNWQIVGNRIMNPINEYLEGVGSLPGFEWVSYHYAEAKTDGTPNNSVCIAFVKATDFTEFDALADIVKLPAGNLSGNLSNPARNSIVNMLFSQFAVPKTIFSSTITRKDIIVNLAKYIHPQFKSMGNHIKDEDFE